jgi:hypothetical protein
MKFADGDGFLDVIIYIIIIVLSIAASAYRNYTKRKEMEQKGQGELFPTFPESDLEPMLEEETYQTDPEYDQNSYPQNAPEPIITPESKETLLPEPIVNTLVTESINEQPTNEIGALEGLSVFEGDSLSTLSEDLTLQQNPMNDDSMSSGAIKDEIGTDIGKEEVIEAFDAKKAVIYSEIINPKYI